VNALGVTWLFDGYEVTMLSLVAVELIMFFNISEAEIGFIASCYLFGCTVGALIFGSLASRYGRKKLFSITLLIYIFSVIGSSFSLTFYELTAFRFLTGVSVGGEYTAIFAAIDEFVPAYVRGKYPFIKS
jgi:MFS family permease